MQGRSHSLSLGHVEILESLGYLEGVLVCQRDDHFLEKLDLLDDLDELADLSRAAMIRGQFHHRLYRTLEIFLLMKLVRQFLPQIVPSHQINAQILLDCLQLVLLLRQVRGLRPKRLLEGAKADPGRQ